MKFKINTMKKISNAPQDILKPSVVWNKLFILLLKIDVSAKNITAEKINPKVADQRPSIMPFILLLSFNLSKK